MAERGWSLRSRLMVMLVALTAVLFGLGTLQNWRANHAARDRLFDDSMREAAGLLLELAQHEIAEHGKMLGIALLAAEAQPGTYGFRFQIWTPDMQAGYRSEALPRTPLLPFAKQGFAWVDIQGARWRAYSTWNADHTLLIQIAQPHAARLALDRQALWNMGASAALLLAAASVLIWLILAAAIKPLQRTAGSVGERSEQDLRQVDAPDAPREVQPLLAALNRLLLRIRTAMQHERRFTADAAHELRTPLAAIRANAQVLLGARDQQEREATARDLLASVDRATRLVEQLLALARADRALDSTTLTQVDLADVAREQIAAHSWQASQRGIQVGQTLQPVRTSADPALVSVLVRNLLDNALRYTPEGGSVQIATGMDPEGEPQLSIEDSGPGIPPAERERAFERFYRLTGGQATGSGLGLSIARRVAEVHGARIGISSPDSGNGTRVWVRFPRQAA